MVTIFNQLLIMTCINPSLQCNICGVKVLLMGYFFIKNIICTAQAVFAFQDKKYLILCVKSMEGENFSLCLVKMLLKMKKQKTKNKARND